ncbi:AAA family ATPase [Flavobacteriaceae bacterium GSB9]|nr:AAA family ATPase [Flavobacteriaceae bacterium GSB9]
MQYDELKTNASFHSNCFDYENNTKEQVLPNGEFSIYKEPITSITPIGETTLPELYKFISTSEDLNNKIFRLREMLFQKGSAVYKKEKANVLPSVTPSGKFKIRKANGLIRHSGIICIDIDDVQSNDFVGLKRRLAADIQIKPILIFTSPCGFGLKVFLKIDVDQSTHFNYFEALESYFKLEYDLEIDKACKDVSRACFLSYDPDAIYNDIFLNEKGLDANFINHWASNQGVVYDNELDINTIEKLYKIGNGLKSKGVCISDDYHDWVRVGHSFCQLGEQGRELFHLFSEVSTKYDTNSTNSKYDALLESYDGRLGIGTIFHMVSQMESIKMVESIGNTIRTASQRMQDAQKMPEIKPLIGVVWQMGELHILFGDTGSGKSVLAIQIANSLSRGINVLNILTNGVGPQKVLVYDFELSDRQFLKRYSDDTNNMYDFHEDFILSDIDFKQLMIDYPNESLDKCMFRKIRQDIKETRANVVIIDNITFLTTQAAQETSVALDLMKELDSMKKEFGISILVLAHTPKVKNGTFLTLNELGGSKHLSNFADSVSCLGKSSQEKDVRYLKQVKPSRSAEIIFDIENVIGLTLNKRNKFLGFDYLDCTHESEHLDFSSPKERRNQKLDMVIELHENGASYRAIESTTGVPKSTVERWVNKHNNNEGQL